MQGVSCVIAGIHVDDVTEAEIDEIVANADNLSDEFIKRELNNGH